MDLSIIICTIYKNSSILETLDSIKVQLQNKVGVEVLVVDNRKEIYDNKLQDLTAEYNFKYFKEPSLGLMGARHAGVENSSGKIVSFIDDDVLVPPNWIDCLLNTYQEEGWKIATGPAYPIFSSELPLWLKKFIETTPYGGWALPWLSVFDLGITRGYISPLYVWGLNFSIDRETFIAHNGFNPDFMPAGKEDYVGDGETGLARKLISNSILSYYDHNLHVFHKCPPERLTVNYFYRRVIYTATGDAYHQVRNSGGLADYSLLKSKFLIFIFWIFEYIASRDNIIKPISKLAGGKYFHYILYLSYIFNFNKYLVKIKKNKNLLNWVCKGQYLNINL